jgi:predicted RNA-binding Zn ribbon-like protein
VEEPLELVRRFVNTLDVESGRDELATPEALAAWLAANGLGGARLRAGPAGLRRAAELREALRGRLCANNGAPSDERDAAALDRQARRSDVVLGFGPGGAELRARAGGVDAALGRILVAVAACEADGSWQRLKACRAETCAWAFVDRSRNGSRHWCSMEVCGNREKARAFRARRAAGRRQA